MTGVFEDNVISNVMGDLFLPKGSYPESFMLISLLEVASGMGVKKGVLGGHSGFLTGDMKGMVILDALDDVGGPL